MIKKQFGIEPKIEKDEDDMGLLAAAEDLLDAIKKDDKNQVAVALRAAFEILDAEPHVEGEHVSEELEEELE